VLLSFGFLILSIDEATMIHETFGHLYSSAGIGMPIFDSHKWLPFGIAFALVAALVFVPFMLKLPRRTAGRILLAGTIFLTGAIGFEFVGALMIHSEFAARGDLIYDLRRITEEAFEMFGIAYFNYILIGELARVGPFARDSERFVIRLLIGGIKKPR
jgi:hypothetical protein